MSVQRCALVEVRGQLLGVGSQLLLWFLEIKLRTSGLQDKPFYLPSDLCGPIFKMD